MSITEWNAAQSLSTDPKSRCWGFVVATTVIPHTSFTDYKDSYFNRIRHHPMTIDLKYVFNHSCLIGYIIFQTHPPKSYVKHILGYPAYLKALTILRSSDPMIYEDLYLTSKSYRTKHWH